MSTRNVRIALVASLVVMLVVAITLVATPWGQRTTKDTFVAFFANANGLYIGDEVRVLGVAVGTVDAIDPQPNSTKVTFSVDRDVAVPADAKAAILSPSLVSARAIQLVPAYSGGPKLAAGSAIPQDRTAVPVEWDDFRQQLEKLTDSLQPTTPGGVSPVGEFINTGADNLRGNGETARDAVIKLSQAVSALGDHSTDIFTTVRNLQLLVSALTSSSDLLAAFNTNLADISTVLSDTPDEVANATQGLDAAVTDLRGFVAENREGVGVTVDKLASITTALNDSRGDIKQVLHITPTVFQNFMNIYQPAQSSVTGILAPVNFANTVQFICSAIEAASRQGFEKSSKLCMQYLAPIIKNRQYNFFPLGVNPFAGASARPNEITYSENRLNPNLPPAPLTNAPPPLGTPLPAEAPLPLAPLPNATSTDPNQGLEGLMVPGGSP
jgi:phospholipid/cholesterol/gamma-HCH transport system substrate-binding protein